MSIQPFFASTFVPSPSIVCWPAIPEAIGAGAGAGLWVGTGVCAATDDKRNKQHAAPVHTSIDRLQLFIAEHPDFTVGGNARAISQRRPLERDSSTPEGIPMSLRMSLRMSGAEGWWRSLLLTRLGGAAPQEPRRRLERLEPNP
jgi:hypothetical protein